MSNFNPINLNFNNVNLAVGTTFTKPSNCLGYSLINFSLECDTNLNIEIQFSSFEDSTFTTQFKYSVSSSNELYDSISVMGAFVRFKITNLSSPQAIKNISLTTRFILQNGGQNIHGDSLIKQNLTGQLVRQLSDFKVDVTNGEYLNLKVKDLTAHCEGLVNTNKVNFWNINNSNVATFFSTNKDLYIKSNNTNDNPVGVGARNINVEYVFLDAASGEYKNGIVSGALNGLTRVSLGVQGIAINSMSVISAGGTTNIGDIIAEADEGGGVFRDMNIIPAGVSISKYFFQVPIHGTNLIINEISYGGTGQFICFIQVCKVNIATGVKSVLLKELVDLNAHYSKMDCAFTINGGTEYLVGEARPHTTPPTTDNFFYLTAKVYTKDITLQV